MKRAHNTLRAVTGLALLAVLVAGLVVVFRAASGGGMLPYAGPLVETPGTPPLVGTLPPPEVVTPTPVVVLPGTPVLVLPGQTDYVATLTPFPTLPPPLTPTRPTGPTRTPLPLPEPARDAAGSILYTVRDKAKGSAICYSLPVDAAGLAQGPATQINVAQEAPWGVVYPAPDGNRLALIGEWGWRSILYMDTGKVEPLFRKDLDPLGVFFGWHPDSRKVLIRAQENYTDVGLWLVDSDTGEHVTLVAQYPSPKFDGGAVSPDGRKVVYSIQNDAFSPGELWMIDADGGDPRLLFTSSVGPIFAVSWSPDSTRIAFVSDGLMTINADGSNPTKLSSNVAVGYLFQPIWSPDSRIIAFVSFDGPNPLSEKGLAVGDWYADAYMGANIHLVDVATGEERSLLADGGTGNLDPSWSPDGTQIVFASTRSGSSEIWAVNADGTNLRQMTNTGQFVRFPYWRRP